MHGLIFTRSFIFSDSVSVADFYPYAIKASGAPLIFAWKATHHDRARASAMTGATHTLKRRGVSPLIPDGNQP
jgi:hypothetical protein